MWGTPRVTSGWVGQELANVFSPPGGARCPRPGRGPWEGGPDWSQGKGVPPQWTVGFRIGQGWHDKVMKVLGQGRLGKVGTLRGGVGLVLRFQGGLGSQWGLRVRGGRWSDACLRAEH